MLQIVQSAFDRLRQHGERAYPNECCGLLLGTVEGEARVATEAMPLENGATSKRSRDWIAPPELARLEKSTGIAILGFYHSHPDHLAQPSATDLAEARWLGCSYLITTVANGSATQTRSFLLAGESEENKRFEAETLRILPATDIR